MLRTAYKYSADTTEYLGDLQVQNDPLNETEWLLPANVVFIEPPTTTTHQVACWNGTEWEIKADYRGTTYYKKADQSKLEIKEIGITPTDEYTDLVPASEEQVWSGDKWDYPLSWYKTKKKAELTACRDAEETEDITTDKGVFEFDELSQSRLLKAMNAMTDEGTRNWTDKEGNVVSMTKADFQTIFDTAATRSDTAFEKSHTLKAQVDAATTIAEVEAIKWEE